MKLAKLSDCILPQNSKCFWVKKMVIIVCFLILMKIYENEYHEPEWIGIDADDRSAASAHFTGGHQECTVPTGGEDSVRPLDVRFTVLISVNEVILYASLPVNILTMLNISFKYIKITFK